MRCAHGGHACVAAVFCICFAHWPAAALTAASLPCRPPWPGPAGRNHAAACAAWPPAACMRTDARTHRRIRTITAASHAQTSRRYAAPHAPDHAAPSLGVTRPARCRFSAYHARAGAEYPPRSHSRTAYGPHHARLHKNILRPPAAGCLTAPPCKRRAAARSARHLPQPDGGLRPGHRPRSFPAQRHKTPGHGRPNRLRMRTPVLCRNVRKKYFNYLFLMIFIIFFTQYGIILTIYKSILSFCRSFPLTKRPVIPKKKYCLLLASPDRGLSPAGLCCEKGVLAVWRPREARKRVVCGHLALRTAVFAFSFRSLRADCAWNNPGRQPDAHTVGGLRKTLHETRIRGRRRRDVLRTEPACGRTGGLCGRQTAAIWIHPCGERRRCQFLLTSQPRQVSPCSNRLSNPARSAWSFSFCCSKARHTCIFCSSIPTFPCPHTGSSTRQTGSGAILTNILAYGISPAQRTCTTRRALPHSIRPTPMACATRSATSDLRHRAP